MPTDHLMKLIREQVLVLEKEISVLEKKIAEKQALLKRIEASLALQIESEEKSTLKIVPGVKIIRKRRDMEQVKTDSFATFVEKLKSGRK